MNLRIESVIKFQSTRLALAIGLLGVNGSAVGKDNEPVITERPAIVQRLFDCRTIADSMERLACYDREIQVVETAAASSELMIADTEQVKEAKRGLFGLSLPDLKIFGSRDEQEVSEIEGTIAAASKQGYQKWFIQLQDGAKWLQTDSRGPSRDPKPGHTIKIRKAAMGSFLANIDGQVAIRMKRVN